MVSGGEKDLGPRAAPEERRERARRSGPSSARGRRREASSASRPAAPTRASGPARPASPPSAALELEAWRAVGQHLDIRAALEALGLLAVDPVRAALLYRLEPERGRIDVVAETSATDEHPPPRTKIELDGEWIAEIAAWSRSGALVRARRRDEHPILQRLAPRGAHGPYLLAPLSTASGMAGALLLFGRAPFTARHDALFRAITAPLAAGLQNDRHLHELTRLRDAMAADRQALLARLDRNDISESVVGAETGLRDVLAGVEQVAPTNTPVLILGETGSGKEVVARAIHTRSSRAKGPMVRVNCGAIPSELVDSELFGHERGSFTGATASRKGWFERADGGTLFLDEIGELPLAAQVRLLRVVQEGLIERVGGERSVRVDVRIVAATHRDLESMVAHGEFRQDLWYRISVFPLRLPPLRERLEDIPSLASHFVLRACKRLGVPPLGLTSEDISMLVSYAWPGNVRELAAVIERATILGDGRRLAIERALGQPAGRAHAGRPFIQAEPATPPLRSPGPIGTLPAPYVRHTPDEAMRQAIEAALTQARGRIEGPFGAAQALGLNPNTLRARLRKLGIDWRHFRLRAPLA